MSIEYPAKRKKHVARLFVYFSFDNISETWIVCFSFDNTLKNFVHRLIIFLFFYSTRYVNTFRMTYLVISVHAACSRLIVKATFHLHMTWYSGLVLNFPCR